MHSCCVTLTGKTTENSGGGRSNSVSTCHCACRAYLFYVSVPGNNEYLVQRPPLQQLGDLPVLLHPLLERRVLTVRALSHLNQVIGKNNQHPVPIAVPIKTIISVYYQADKGAQRTGSSLPYSSISVAWRSLSRWFRPSACTFNPCNSPPSNNQIKTQ